MRKFFWVLFFFLGIFVPFLAFAQVNAEKFYEFPLIFLFIIALLLAGRIGALTEKFGQPAVFGELIMGMLISALVFVPGFHKISILANDPLVMGIAEIGVILLLFQIGLESNLGEMQKVGWRSFLVASVGVILPFIGGFYASQVLMPGFSSNTHLFLGAALTATSVGISSRVFKDLRVMKTIEAKIVLGAAVIDDVLGLLLLAVVGGIVSVGYIEVSTITVLCLKAVAFFVGAIVLGRLVAPFLGRIAARIHPGVGMKTAIALIFCASFAYMSHSLAGLAPIVGAFAAGLILDPLYFANFSAPYLVSPLRTWAKELKKGSIKFVKLANAMEKEATQKETTHVSDLIENLCNFFVPIFFVYTGLQVDFVVFSQMSTVGIALVITIIAILGKMFCGYAAGRGVDHFLIGFGMVPRGEVGLVFLNVGKRLGVVNDKIFAIGIIMVLLTTLISPEILHARICRKKH